MKSEHVDRAQREEIDVLKALKAHGEEVEIHWGPVPRPIECLELEQGMEGHRAVCLLCSGTGRPPTWDRDEFEDTVTKLHGALAGLRAALNPAASSIPPKTAIVKEEPKPKAGKKVSLTAGSAIDPQALENLQLRIISEVSAKQSQGKLFVPYGYSVAFSKKSDSDELEVFRVRNGDKRDPNFERAQGLAIDQKTEVEVVGDYDMLKEEDQDLEWESVSSDDEAMEARNKLDNFMDVDPEFLEALRLGQADKLDSREKAVELAKKNPADIMTISRRVSQAVTALKGPEAHLAGKGQAATPAAGAPPGESKDLKKRDPLELLFPPFDAGVTGCIIPISGQGSVPPPSVQLAALHTKHRDHHSHSIRFFQKTPLVWRFQATDLPFLEVPPSTPPEYFEKKRKAAEEKRKRAKVGIPPPAPLNGRQPSLVASPASPFVKGPNASISKRGADDRGSKARLLERKGTSSSGSPRNSFGGGGGLRGNLNPDDEVSLGEEELSISGSLSGDRAVSFGVDDENEDGLLVEDGEGDGTGALGAGSYRSIRSLRSRDPSLHRLKRAASVRAGADGASADDEGLEFNDQSLALFMSLKRGRGQSFREPASDLFQTGPVRPNWNIPSEEWIDSRASRLEAMDSAALKAQLHQLTLLDQTIRKRHKRATNVPTLRRQIFTPELRLRPVSVGFSGVDSSLHNVETLLEPFAVQPFLPRPTTQQGNYRLVEKRPTAELPPAQQWANMRRVPRPASVRELERQHKPTLPEIQKPPNESSGAVYVAKQTTGRLLSPLRRDRRPATSLNLSSETHPSPILQPQAVTPEPLMVAQSWSPEGMSAPIVLPSISVGPATTNRLGKGVASPIITKQTPSGEHSRPSTKSSKKKSLPGVPVQSAMVESQKTQLGQLHKMKWMSLHEGKH